MTRVGSRLAFRVETSTQLRGNRPNERAIHLQCARARSGCRRCRCAGRDLDQDGRAAALADPARHLHRPFVLGLVVRHRGHVPGRATGHGVDHRAGCESAYPPTRDLDGATDYGGARGGPDRGAQRYWNGWLRDLTHSVRSWSQIRPPPTLRTCRPAKRAPQIVPASSNPSII